MYVMGYEVINSLPNCEPHELHQLTTWSDTFMGSIEAQVLWGGNKLFSDCI